MWRCQEKPENFSFWMPVRQLPVRLNGRDHTGHDIIAPQNCPANLQDSLPCQPGKLARQFPVEAKIQPETFRHGEHELPVRNSRTDVFGNVDRGHQCPLLVTRRADSSASGGLARNSDEELVTAVRTANAGKAGIPLGQSCIPEKSKHSVASPFSYLAVAADVRHRRRSG